MLKKVFLSFILVFLFFSVGESKTNEVDCLILKDENSIICKYSVNSVNFDRDVTIQWIDPSGLVSREREITIPAFNISVYDFRYKNGREKGKWEFKVIDGQKHYSTNFTIK